jgi:pantetheine-phosphate adenylyltransferase
MNPVDYTSYYSLFAQFGMNLTAMQDVLSRWREPHRYYHNESHLHYLLQEIEKLAEQGQISTTQKENLLMIAFFHDAVYDATAADNEEKSAELFRQLTQQTDHTGTITQAILDTKTHQPTSDLSGIFCNLDMAIVTRSDFQQMLAWEKGIAREYQFVDYSLYKTGRIALLEHFAKQYPENKANLQNLIHYLTFHKPQIGIYAGSFNPFHNGHLNILEKAEQIFDKVIVAQGINPEKETASASLKKLAVLKYRQIEQFGGLLTDYISSKEAHAQMVLVRGLRNGDDLSYEVNQLRFMEDMKPGLKMVFIRCDMQFEHISSSAIRNLEKIEKGLGSKYLPV